MTRIVAGRRAAAASARQPPKPEAAGRGAAPAPRHRARLHDHRLLIVGAVVDHELDLVLADLDRVVVAQQLLLDGLAVDVGAVGAVEVLDEDVGPTICSTACSPLTARLSMTMSL
jgi:hypothetical protein